MAINSKMEERDVKGVKVPTLIVEFTNGTIEQLDNLSEFLKTKGIDIPEGKTDQRANVVKMGIGLLETLNSQSNSKTE